MLSIACCFLKLLWAEWDVSNASGISFPVHSKSFPSLSYNFQKAAAKQLKNIFSCSVFSAQLLGASGTAHLIFVFGFSFILSSVSFSSLLFWVSSLLIKGKSTTLVIFRLLMCVLFLVKDLFERCNVTVRKMFMLKV